MAEFKVEVPGTYSNVDHAIFRIAKGAVGLIKVRGGPVCLDRIPCFISEVLPVSA